MFGPWVVVNKLGMKSACGQRVPWLGYKCLVSSC